MKKTILMRCLIGAPIGFTISTIITIIISMTIGDGYFYPVVPELIEECGTELNAVLLQALFSLVYGAALGGASVVWKMEHWSLLRQTVTHLIICSLSIFPIAYFMKWMPHNPTGIVMYFLFFTIIYTIIWLMEFYIMKKRIQQINDKVKAKDF